MFHVRKKTDLVEIKTTELYRPNRVCYLLTEIAGVSKNFESIMNENNK